MQLFFHNYLNIFFLLIVLTKCNDLIKGYLKINIKFLLLKYFDTMTNDIRYLALNCSNMTENI